MTSLPRTWRGYVVWSLRHPRTTLAAKTAVAATLAWLAAVNIPGPVSEYPFYAPLGAVIATYPTIAASIRESLQGVAAITLGGTIALVAQVLMPGGGAALVAVVVGAGVLVAGLPALGDLRSYVPTAALFVLVLGGREDFEYAASYAGLFFLGAAIAVLLNLALPSLPLPQVDEALDRLRTTLQEHLGYLADRIGSEDEEDGRESGGAERHGEPEEPGEPVEEHGPGRSGLTRLVSDARDVVLHARDATRGNVRAKRIPGAVDRRYDSFRALERVVLLIDDLYELFADEPWGQDIRETPHELREPMARALEELASTVAAVGVSDPDPEQRAAVDRAISELTTATQRHREAGGDQAQVLVISVIITNLRRCLSVVTPPDLLSERPT